MGCFTHDTIWKRRKNNATIKENSCYVTYPTGGGFFMPWPWSASWCDMTPCPLRRLSPCASSLRSRRTFQRGSMTVRVITILLTGFLNECIIYNRVNMYLKELCENIHKEWHWTRRQYTKFSFRTSYNPSSTQQQHMESEQVRLLKYGFCVSWVRGLDSASWMQPTTHKQTSAVVSKAE